MNIIHKLIIFYSIIVIIETIVLIIIIRKGKKKVKSICSNWEDETRVCETQLSELSNRIEKLNKDNAFKIKEERALSLLSEKNLKEAFKSEIDTLKEVIKQLEKEGINAHKIISDLNKQLTKKL